MNENLKNVIAKQFRNTALGFRRIRKNLNLNEFTDGEIEEYLKQVISSTPLGEIEKKGKNYYFKSVSNNAILTINSHSFTIITAKQISKRTKISSTQK